MTKNEQSHEPQILDKVIHQLQGEPWLVFDLFRPENDKHGESIMCWTLAGPSSIDVLYIPIIDKDNSEKNSLFPSQHQMDRINELIAEKPLVGYDLLPVMLFMEQRLKWELPLFWKSDVMVEAHILGAYPRVELSYLVETLYGAKLKSINDLYPEACQTAKKQNILSFEEIPVEVLNQVAGERALYIRNIHEVLYCGIVDKDPKLRKLHRLEMDILPIVAEMQQAGIRIDSEKCRSEYTRLMVEAQTLSNSFHGWLRRNFNITEHYDFNSSAQTAELLIDRLRIMHEVKTNKGHRSTSKKIFERLRDSSPVVNAIYTYRELIKSATGSYDLYPHFKGFDGRLHPRLLTCRVISGRTASEGPNIQQIPKENIWEFLDFDDTSSDECAVCKAQFCPSCQKAKHKTLQTAVREVFVPREGYLFVEGDYSQIELMVLAGVSNEPKMLQAFQQEIDIHSQTAALIFSVSLDKVTKEQRQVGKTTNFRFNYGGGPRGLAVQLGISLEQAVEINRAYSRAYPMIDEFALKSAREATMRGYVETLFGRIRYMPEFQAKDAKTRARGRRLAINLQIQGGAADIAKIGLIRQDQARQKFDRKHSCKTHLVNFVHDSFLWEVPIISNDPVRQANFIRAFVEGVRKALCFDVAEMTGIGQFPELKVDFKIGVNYHEMVGINEWEFTAGQ